MAASLDVEGRRLLWRCRRGLKELDVLLGRYVEAVLPQADAAQRRALTRLLELSDPQLAGYLLGGVVPADAELAALAGRIRGTGGGVRARCGMIGGRSPSGGAGSEDI